MIITEMKRLKKSLYGVSFSEPVDPADYGAECDKNGFLVLDAGLCDKENIRVGTVLDSESLSGLVQKHFCRRAKERAFWYLSRSDTSKKQLYMKLCRAFPDFAAEYAVGLCEELHYLDDRRYAENLAENLITVKKFAPRAAISKMREKGIDRETAEEAVMGVETDPTEALKALIESKYKNRLGDEKGRRNTAAALARRGFSFTDIKKALQEYSEESEFSEELME